MSELPRIPALAQGNTLRAPKPGWFRCTVADQQPIGPDDIIGELDVLGRTILIIAPDIRGVAGMRELHPETLDSLETSRGLRRAVGYGDILLRVVAATDAHSRPTAEANGTAPASQHAAHGMVFRAPTAGRFYARSSPDKPLFVSIGTELTPGVVVCLLEVMKTFSRITYSGAPARVRAVLVSDGSDVKAGDPVLELEPL